MSDLVRRHDSGELTEMSAHALLTVARQALAEADNLPEITQLVDRAAVIRLAAQRAKLSRDAQNDWGEYKLDAERKAGKALAQMDLHIGGRPIETSDKPSLVSTGPTLQDLGVDRKRSSRWQLLASLPDDDYESFKADVRADTEKVITQGELSPLEIGMHALAARRWSSHENSLKAYAERIGMPLPSISRLRSAAEVSAKIENDCIKATIRDLGDRATHLYEISKAPSEVWPILVDALISREWTVTETKKHVDQVRRFELSDLVYATDWLPITETVARYLEAPDRLTPADRLTIG